MGQYPGFEQFEIDQKIERHMNEIEQLTEAGVGGRQRAVLGEFCISVKVEGDKVCIDAPIVGDICVPLPISVPDGTLAKACATVHVFPPKVCITVYIGDVKITEQCFGA